MLRYLLALAFFFSPILALEAADTTPASIHDQSQAAKSPPDEIQEMEKEASSESFTMQLLSMFTTLGILVVAVLIFTWFMKRLLNTRLQQMNSTSAVKIIERRALSPKSIIYILEVKDQGIILSESSNGIALLSTFPADQSETKQDLDEKK